MVPETGLGHPLPSLALFFFRFFLGRLVRLVSCWPSESIIASGAIPSLPLLPEAFWPPLPPGSASEPSRINICGESRPPPPSS